MVLRCALRLSDTEKALEQSLQMNGFSTECVLMCLLRLPESENGLKHSLQANGFIICSNCRSIVFCMLGPSLMNQNNFSFEVTNAVIASFCVLGDFVMIQSYFFEVMNAVIARVLDCFYLMEHSMVHQYKCRDCKNTVFCISNMQKNSILAITSYDI